ncbi:hypothetical protein [Algibacter sp. R77976]|uniref:hypothetical protein n=1 Tax=Algibacter sp. R77976 TaxID=3093873 RepID=UPI0037C808FF
MRRFLIILFVFKMADLQAQTESNSNIKVANNLFSKGYLFNTPILSNLSFQNGVFIADYGAFSQLEIPILFNHKLNDKWNVFFGSQISTITNYQTNLLGKRENGFQNFDVSLYLGSEYQLSEKVLGKVSLKYTILRKQNNSFESVEIDDNPLKFNVGVKF